MVSNVIVALDFSTEKEVFDFLNQFDSPIYVKVGMELFYQVGPGIIRKIKEKGHKIFLDLKLHDIPNTVFNAMRGLKTLGVDMVNVHAAGGIAMMKAAKEALGDDVLLVAVTQLTSTSETSMKYEQLIEASLEASVINYAQITKEAGLDGVVCSPLEVKRIQETLGKDFLCVTPGIRPLNYEKDDQVRITTPEDARIMGSSHIVVGRPITKAKDPKKAYLDIVKQWEEAYEENSR